MSNENDMSLKHTINLPASVTTFDAHDFGNYTPRGFSASAKAGVASGIPIAFLFSGRWLELGKAGDAGTMFVFRDAEGAEVGRAHMPSRFERTPKQLLFTVSKFEHTI